MRAASAGLISLLLSKQPTWQADLFTFSLLNGTTLRLCSADTNITYGGNTWSAANAGSVGITQESVEHQNTLDVPSLEIDIISSSTDYAGRANIKLAMHNGLLDGAWITLDRAIMQVINGVHGDTTLGVVNIFAGRTGQVQVMSTGAKITVRGANVLMNQYMPKNILHDLCAPHSGRRRLHHGAGVLHVCRRGVRGEPDRGQLGVGPNVRQLRRPGVWHHRNDIGRGTRGNVTDRRVQQHRSGRLLSVL